MMLTYFFLDLILVFEGCAFALDVWCHNVRLLAGRTKYCLTIMGKTEMNGGLDGVYLTGKEGDVKKMTPAPSSRRRMR